MEHEALAFLIDILVDYGFTKKQAVELISALLAQEAECALEVIEEARKETFC